jgi:hypothetical protein
VDEPRRQSMKNDQVDRTWAEAAVGGHVRGRHTGGRTYQPLVVRSCRSSPPVAAQSNCLPARLHIFIRTSDNVH